MKINRCRFLIVFFILFCWLAVGLSAFASDLDSAVERLLKIYDLPKARVGIKIVSLADPAKPDLIYQKKPNDHLAVASNVKLFTTGVALCLLGPDFKYRTTLYRTGPVRDNVLEGKLVVKSNGDPNISGRFHDKDVIAVFKKWGQRLRNLGVKKIKGGIIIDDTAFDRVYQPPTWPVGDLSYWYAAQVSAVSFNDNCVDLTVYYDQEKKEVKYRLDPPTEYVTIINQCRPVAKAPQQLDFAHSPGTNTITIKGIFRIGTKPHQESITIDQPGLYFGTVLKETLIHQKGIVIHGNIKLASTMLDESKLVELISEESTLLQSIEVTNKRSQNFYAEQILKTLGASRNVQGTFPGGLKVVRDFLAKEISLTAKDYTMLDGSGLSAGNEFSADHIITWLAYLTRHKYFDQFRESLFRPGIDPPASGKLRLTEFKGRLWFKTGYIKNAYALSGYFKNKKGHYGAFAVLVNDFPKTSNVKKFQDELLKLVMN